jgi:Histidine kinase-, DNA gyrase B-, and HSP90-like ATPase
MALPSLEDGVFVTIPVEAGDVGGELLPILSKGLYTYPLHAIREYVQNAVDAGATQATIKITGNSVLIHDNGEGMDLARLVQARQFGVSTKDIKLNVGFRGIGIYSGFDLCNRLLITTKRADESSAYVLEFDFGSMKDRLAREVGSDKRTPLVQLLAEYSRFSREEERKGPHYTTVQLEDISDVHLQQLGDRALLKEYILENLPIDFDPAFEHRAEITDRLKRDVKGYNAITVVLESDQAPQEVIAKPAIPNLSKPVMNAIPNRAGEPIAFYWACLTTTRKQIDDKFAPYRGFVYKMKGFTIGDNSKLRSAFTRGNSGLYWWYTGEIYVLNADVVPNTARDNFETNSAERELDLRVRDALTALEKTAATYQAEARAQEKFANGNDTLVALENKVSEGHYGLVETFSEVSQLIDDLNRQLKKLPAGEQQGGKEIVARATKIKQRLQKEADKPPTTKERQKEAAKKGSTEDSSSSTETDSESASGGGGETPETAPLRTMTEILEQAGWAVTGDIASIIGLVDEAIADALGSGTEQHRTVLAAIEAKLAAESSE